MIGGSQQLRLFRRAIRDGATLEEACAATGDIIGPAEGRIYLEQDRKSPPPPEAYELLYDPEQRKELTMARPKKSKDETANGDINGEYKTPNAKEAFDIYNDSIAPKMAAMATLRGDCAEPWRNIKDIANFPRPVMNFLIVLGNIDDDAKRDHYLLALHEGLMVCNLTLPADMITTMAGTADGPVVPVGGRNRPFLAAVTSDEDDAEFEAAQAEVANSDVGEDAEQDAAA